MRIRVHGDRTEITEAVMRLRDVFVVAEVSRLYPDRPVRRGRYRVYVDAYRPNT